MYICTLNKNKNFMIDWQYLDDGEIIKKDEYCVKTFFLYSYHGSGIFISSSPFVFNYDILIELTHIKLFLDKFKKYEVI